MKFLFIILVASLSLAYASQDPQNADPYYRLTKVVKEVPVSLETILVVQQLFSQQQEPISVPTPSAGGPGLGEIINIGLKVWKIIEQNQPVVNLNLQRASALPAGLRDWSEMEGWSDIQVREYQVSYINGFKKEVVKLNMLLTYSYGGKYNGSGQYLSQVGVLIKDLEVSWGFTVSGEVEVANLVNIGTRENPHALMELDIKWSVHSVMKHIQEGINFLVKGNGDFRSY